MNNKIPSRENWLDIPEWVGFYQVSDKGRIRSLPRSIMRRHGKSTRVGGRVLTPFMRDGYLSVHLNDMDKTQTKRVHRLVMLAFEGPSKLEVDHKNRNRRDNRLVNLRYVTHKENMANAKLLKGEEQSNSKLTEGDVRSIRQRYEAGGISQRKLAKEYGVALSLINGVIKRTKWAHIE